MEVLGPPPLLEGGHGAGRLAAWAALLWEASPGPRDPAGALYGAPGRRTSVHKTMISGKFPLKNLTRKVFTSHQSVIQSASC